MKNIIRPKNLFKSIFLFTLSLFIFTSCYKDEDTTLRVTVKDRQNNLISGITVVVDGGSVIDLTKTSSSAGTAVFDLTSYFKDGQSGLFVLDVDIYNPLDLNNPLGYETVNIEPHIETDITVYID